MFNSRTQVPVKRVVGATIMLTYITFEVAGSVHELLSTYNVKDCILSRLDLPGYQHIITFLLYLKTTSNNKLFQEPLYCPSDFPDILYAIIC